MGNTEIGILVIAGVCTLVLVIGILKKRAQILLNFAVRAAVCLILSYFLDTFLASRGIPVSVGLNLISLLTFETLGFYGMAALYGILFLGLL